MHLCVRMAICVWLCVTSMQTCSCAPNPVTEDQTLSGFMFVMNRYAGDSKTDPWDDPKIRTGSCSGDLTVIRFQNRVISFKCLLLYQFLIYHCQYYLYVSCIISFDRLIYLTSMITRTISYDISDRTPYVFS